MDHTNILKIYEFYEAPDSYYLITEIFEGRELFDVILEYILSDLETTDSLRRTQPISCRRYSRL